MAAKKVAQPGPAKAPVCDVPDCKSKATVHGLCRKHYDVMRGVATGE